MPPAKINTGSKRLTTSTKVPSLNGSRTTPKLSTKAKINKPSIPLSIKGTTNLKKEETYISSNEDIKELSKVQSESDVESDTQSSADSESSLDSPLDIQSNVNLNSNRSNTSIKDSTTFTYIIEGKEQMKNEMNIQSDNEEEINELDIVKNTKDLNQSINESRLNSKHDFQDTTNVTIDDTQKELTKDINEVDMILTPEIKLTQPLSRQLFTSSISTPNKTVTSMSSTVSNDIRFSIKNNKYSFLSNFYCSEFIIDTITYNHVEGYYQSQKFIDSNPKAAKHISAVVSPMACKRIASTYTLLESNRKKWDFDLRDKVMKRALYVKFTTSQELLAKLIATEDGILINDTELDKYWGQDRTGKGENNLGKMLMEIRSALKFCI